MLADLTTTVDFKKGIIEHSAHTGSHVIFTEILDTKEAHTRHALMLLGWKPPKTETPLGSKPERAERQKTELRDSRIPSSINQKTNKQENVHE